MLCGNRLCFVVETRSGLFSDDLGDRDSARTECGRAHLRALEVSEAPAQ
jgi:type III restriction enzyme